MAKTNFIISSVGKNIINSLSSGILILDVNGKILLANNKAPDIYHFDGNQDFIMDDYHLLLPTQIIQEIEKAYPKIISGETYRINEIKINLSEDDYYYLGATLYPLYNEWGKVIGIIINGRDITRFIIENEEKKQLKVLNQRLSDILEKFKFQNKQLNLANSRNETIINTIIQTIASPINMMESGLSSLEKKYQIDQESFEYSILKESYQQLVKLKNQIVSLNYSESNEVTFTNFCMKDIVNKTLSEFQEKIKKKNINTIVNLKNTEINVSANQHEIETVLKYVIDNAICYNHPDGKITITDEKWEGYYFLTIEDNGIGIPADDMPNIFTPFYRGSNTGDYPSGNGLNLTIAKTIIEKNHGAIRLESNPGAGTKLTFYLKASPSE